MSSGRGTPRGGGLSIAGRFCLWMSTAMLVVMTAAGFFLLDKSRDALGKATTSVLNRAAQLTAEAHRSKASSRRDVVRAAREVDRETSQWRLHESEVLNRLDHAHPTAYEQRGTNAVVTGGVTRFPIRFKEGSSAAGEPGVLVRPEGGIDLVALADRYGGQEHSLFGLILLVTAAILAVGTGVAFGVSKQITKPIETLVDDVRSIARGNLHHRTRVRGGGEVQHLARQIVRMAQSLEEAQDQEVQLGMREREREVALGVREALLPDHCPEAPGFTIADLHLDASEAGGDFHDFVQVGDKVVMLICEVSGHGVPGALVGATARAYLRSELGRSGSLAEDLFTINRALAQDVRRGMYVTALVVVLDPSENVATVACAGHKLPLVRYSAEDRQVRLVQPGGIALGFDKGPIFERGLETVRVPLSPGDRLVLSTTGPVLVQSRDGEEYGEKPLYRLVARYAEEEPEVMLNGILTSLEAHADGEEFPADISLVIASRDA